MKKTKIAIVIILALSLTGLFSISLSATQVVWDSGVDNNIGDEVDEESTVDTTYSYNGFTKMAFLNSTGDRDDIMEVGEEIVWNLTIIVKNTFEWDMENVTVTDIIPPQFIVWEEERYPSYSNLVIVKKGKGNGATHVTWEIGILKSEDIARLELTICTGGKVRKQHYNKPGHYKLNSGAKLKFTKKDTGFKYHAHTEKIEFDIPGRMTDIVYLYEKDSEWEIVDGGAKGRLVYNLNSSKFEYKFYGHGLYHINTEYSLIYYADPWPGNNTGALIASGSTDGLGNIHLVGSIDLGMDLPHPDDANYPDGAKIWLVLSTDYDPNKNSMIGWNPAEYLFENNLITYDDT